MPSSLSVSDRRGYEISQPNHKQRSRESDLLFIAQKKEIHKRTDGHEDLQILSRRDMIHSTTAIRRAETDCQGKDGGTDWMFYWFLLVYSLRWSLCSSQSLQVDYGPVTAALLFELIDVQPTAANGSLVNEVPRSGLTPFSDLRPTTSDSLVNELWFTSPSFSLTTELFAVLTKQWIHQYMTVSSGTPRDRCRVRQFRYMGLQQWRVGFITGLLPIFMSTLFCIF
ncbi:hypothetical protein EV421DRAFT_1997677 [Armillaria borealis]|uniref:DUF6535 domain-containing protein n=1 Tax=Armillaria borealis TaxID=47425 RepID=A0AA39J164_9AGAR|nr:hypothetical protein EV421DRAFT_1997677 [Armillaria borealis]